MEKTNVMRILDQKGVEYTPYEYNKDLTDGVSVANSVGIEEDRVFKTLVTVANNKNYYVFMIPVAQTLNLKKAASSVNVKSIEMIKQKDLLPLTGYVHGGCSPIGMKKQFQTIIDETAILFDKIVFSAGKIGYQVEIDPMQLKELVNISYIDIV